jgi:hypothetical protein
MRFPLDSESINRSEFVTFFFSAVFSGIYSPAEVEKFRLVRDQCPLLLRLAALSAWSFPRP